MSTRFATLLPLVRNFDSLFDEAGFPRAAAPAAHECSGLMPALDIAGTDEALVVTAEVPGFAMQDLEVSVLGDELTLEGRREIAAAEGTSFFHRERGVGRFRRVLSLPVAVDSEGVSAELKDGVLTIRLPKAAVHRPRKIEVKPAG
ncbi:MAG: Hsp20/alpha crystallin family protein [Planctomycetota bacterium]